MKVSFERDGSLSCSLATRSTYDENPKAASVTPVLESKSRWMQAVIDKINTGVVSIARSTGGLVAATPLKVKIPKGPATQAEADAAARIWVQYKVMQQHGDHVSYCNRVKEVAPSEIHEMFGLSTEFPPRFAVDFGRGLIPVYVFLFSLGEDGASVAHFAEVSSVERLIGLGAERKLTIETYSIEPAVLRYMGGSDSTARLIYAKMFERYHALTQSQRPIVPRAFRNPFSLTIAGCESPAQVRERLRRGTVQMFPPGTIPGNTLTEIHIFDYMKGV